MSALLLKKWAKTCTRALSIVHLLCKEILPHLGTVLPGVWWLPFLGNLCKKGWHTLLTACLEITTNTPFLLAFLLVTDSFYGSASGSAGLRGLTWQDNLDFHPWETWALDHQDFSGCGCSPVDLPSQLDKRYQEGQVHSAQPLLHNWWP